MRGTCFCILEMSLRPMPMAWHSAIPLAQVTARQGASPLDPLVHIFNPSPYTHVKSQLPYSILLKFLFFSFFFFQTV